MSDARFVEVIREATPGEVCVNEFQAGEDDWYPCGDAAELLFRVTEDGTAADPLLCASCGEQLKVEIKAQPGGDAILP